MRRRWNEFWFSPGDPVTLGVCRALFFGGLFLWQLPHDFSPWGAYSQVFWMPIWLFDTLGLRPFGPTTIAVLQTIWKASLLLSALGLFSRPAMIVAFLIGTYLMGLPQNFGQTQHFDTLIVFASGALAISRAADAFSVDAWRRAHARDALGTRRAPGALKALEAPEAREAPEAPEAPQVPEVLDRGEYTWPIRFIWVAMAVIFCAAGLSKLRHSGIDWFLSDNMAWLLLRQQYHISDGEPLTHWGIWIANHPWIARAMAAGAVTIETCYPIVLFSRWARFVVAPAGLLFLVGIRALMGPTFEQFMMCYVFWIPWGRLIAAAQARTARRQDLCAA